MSDWIQTFTGRKFRPLNPSPEDVDILDIAHALSNVCRFTGHCKMFYSVAQHSVLVSLALDLHGKHHPDLALWGLLHDATEAYICDMARPVKRGIPAYQEIEHRLEQCMAEAFGISREVREDPRVKEADLRLLATERRDLMGDLIEPKPWSETNSIEPFPGRINPQISELAEAEFMARFMVLSNRRKAR